MLQNEVQHILKEALASKAVRLIRVSSAINNKMTRGEALKLKLDFQRAISKERKLSTKMYPPEHVLYNTTPYDFLSIGIRFSEKFDSWVVVINANETALEVYSSDPVPKDDVLRTTQEKPVEDTMQISIDDSDYPSEDDFTNESLLGKSLF